MLLLGLIDIPLWLICIAIITSYVLYTMRDFNYFSSQGIPGPRPIPILGTSYKNILQPIAYRDLDCLKEYGDVGVFGEFYGGTITTVVHDAELLSQVMVKEFSTFSNRWNIDSSLASINKHLFGLKDAHWKHVRQLMTPTFTLAKLKMMNDEINDAAKLFADCLAEATKSHTVAVKEYAGNFTMDVISRTAFGIHVNSQKENNNEFLVNAKKFFYLSPRDPYLILNIFSPKLVNLLIKYGPNHKDTKHFFYNVTKQIIEKTTVENDSANRNFVRILIDCMEAGLKQNGDKDAAPAGMTIEEIMANAMTFFLAGYETTATSLTYFMYNMACTPDAQEKLMEEITKIIGDKDFIEINDLQNMPYLDQCLNESLRRYPPILRVNRRVKRDITIKNVFFRKDTIVAIPIFVIHMDPRKWPEPEKFDPERFSEENKTKRNPYHFMPFGYGPRTCIAQRLALSEIKIAIIHVMRKVKFSTCERTEVPVVFKNAYAFLTAKKPIELKVEPRIMEKTPNGQNHL